MLLMIFLLLMARLRPEAVHYQIGDAAAVRVRRAVEGTINGVKVVAKTAVGRTDGAGSES